MNPRFAAHVLSLVLTALVVASCGLLGSDPIEPDPIEPDPIDPTNTFGCGGGGTTPTVAYDDEGRPYVTGRLLVGYSDPTHAAMSARDPGERISLQRDLGLRTLRHLDPTTDLVRVQGDALLAAQRLRADDRVAYVHPDYLLTATAPTDDPRLEDQWSLEAYGATTAWDVRTSADGEVVAIVDSGFDVTHPDLEGRFLPGWDFCHGDDDVRTPDWHGTHVAGIIGAIGDNGRGIAGVAWDGVDLLPVRIFSDDGAYAAISDAVAGILWAAGLPVTAPGDGRAGPPINAHPADVINLSLGAMGTIESLDRAICRAHEAGVLIVAATGNWENGLKAVMSPANGPCAFAVGSVGPTGEVSEFSRYTVGDDLVDVVAPGEDIVSTIPAGDYGSLDGTSMATPYVSAVAALLLAHDDALTADGVAARLKATAWRPEDDDARPWYSDGSTVAERYGAGIVCIEAALDPTLDPTTGSGCGPVVDALVN